MIDWSIKSNSSLSYQSFSNDSDDGGCKQLAVTLNMDQFEYFTDVSNGIENPQKPPNEIRLNSAKKPTFDEAAAENLSLLQKDNQER